MNAIAIWMLVAALLPLVATITAKAGGQGFSNREPRAWLASQQGWRSRANSAQQNLFESLPFFFAAVLFVLYREGDPGTLATWMAAWVFARLVYIGCYVADFGTLRSLVWLAALAINIAILFSA